MTGDARRMTDSIIHRGPDDQGHFIDAETGVALGFRRLAILDLSPTGAQPMSSPSGRWVITMNGEIYNYPELRAMIEPLGVKLRGTSDTETLVNAIEAFGISKALELTNGMFAVAAYDREARKLYLARDRFGEKPLYYGRSGGAFVYGSELKSFRALPQFDNAIDRDALAAYFRYLFVPAPHTIYEGIRKLPPGAFAVIDLEDEGRNPVIESYWTVEDQIQNGLDNPFTGTFDGAVDQLEVLMEAAVKRQLASDVPLGAFLSGGFDSTLTVALMRKLVPNVRTFTIGFEAKEYNEAAHAKAVAQHLGTDHTELILKASDMLDIIPRLSHVYDEPFADSSQLPTIAVSELARKHVTVALTGDGGDEIFSGYAKYFRGIQAAQWRKRLGPARSLVASGLSLVPPSLVDRMMNAGSGPTGSSLEKIDKFKSILRLENPSDISRDLTSHWKSPLDVVRAKREAATIYDDPRIAALKLGSVREMQAYDQLLNLPDDMLVKVDRAAMSISLECRTPFLDKHVARFAWSLPIEYCAKPGLGKIVVKELCYRHVPREIMDRPKMGFGAPIDSWLRHELKDWADSLLDAKKLEQQGYLNAKPIRQAWDEHQSGKRNHRNRLWIALMFQQWLAAQ